MIWLRERDLTINPDAVWKNRYTGDEFTLKGYTFFEYCSNSDQSHSPKEFYPYFDKEAFLLWENNLPKDKWEGSNMFEKQQGKLNYMQDEKPIKEESENIKPKIAQRQIKLGESSDTEIKAPEQKKEQKPIQTAQIKIGETAEDLKAKQLEESKCPICHELKPKEFDICNNEANVEACVDCIRKRHKKHGLVGEGFTANGDLISFYSMTTEMETFNLKDFTRVFEGFMANSIFPYSVNLETTKTVNNKCLHCGTDLGNKLEKDNHCFGVTKEFGEWLIKQGIRFEKEKEEVHTYLGENIHIEDETMKDDEDEESEDFKKKKDDDSQEEFEEEENEDIGV